MWFVYDDGCAVILTIACGATECVLWAARREKSVPVLTSGVCESPKLFSTPSEKFAKLGETMWTEVWYDDCCESGISDWICSFVLHHLQKSNKMNKLANSLNMTIPHHAPQAERFQASPLHRAAAETSSLDLICPGNLTRNSQSSLVFTQLPTVTPLWWIGCLVLCSRVPQQWWLQEGVSLKTNHRQQEQ